MNFGVFWTNRTVCNRGVGIIEAGIGWSLVSLGPVELSRIGVSVRGGLTVISPMMLIYLAR